MIFLRTLHKPCLTAKLDFYKSVLATVEQSINEENHVYPEQDENE